MVRLCSRIWTPPHIAQLKALIAAGSSVAEAAIVLRRSVMVVQGKARRLGLSFEADAIRATDRAHEIR